MNFLLSKKKKQTLSAKFMNLRIIQFIIGSLFISIGYNIFVVPNKIVPGGVTGLAIIANKLFGIDNSLFILCANIILLLISYKLLGEEKTKASVFGSLLLPFFIKITENINVWLQFDTSAVLLTTLFGGIIYGFGAGLVFKAGFTTGGTDIINQIITKYAKSSIGKSMLMSDGIIVLSSGLFIGINTMLYSILMLYIISLMSDKLLLGISDSKVFYIITAKDEEIKEFIINTLGQGVTIFKGKGGYEEENKKVLMSVLPTQMYHDLKDGIKEIDSKAFYIITDTYQVYGGD